MFRVAIVTASDSRSKGEAIDYSTEAAEELVVAHGWQVTSKHLVPDEIDAIAEVLKMLADNGTTDLILTTGGTGFSPRDVTPEATLQVIERLVPGIPEYIRYKSFQITPRAILSRATAGIRYKTLIVNLPGSPKAVRECLGWILGPLSHGMDILCEKDSQCGI